LYAEIPWTLAIVAARNSRSASTVKIAFVEMLKRGETIHRRERGSSTGRPR